MKVRKAVITAAARDDRLYPAATTVQKAMLPVIDTDGINKPLIQVIAEEALGSGIEELCIVCAPGDEEKYLENFRALYSTHLKMHRQSVWAETQAMGIKNVLDRLSFVVQPEPLGYGHAVYQARDFVGNAPFLLLHGDYLYISNVANKRCAGQILELAEQEECSVSAVTPMIEHQIGKYGTLTGRSLSTHEGVYQIERIVEKPSVSEAELELKTPGLRSGYYLCFFGLHIFQPSVFDFLSEEVKARAGGNILLTPVQKRIARDEKYLALEIKGRRYDTSRKFGLLQAQIALGLSGQTRDELLVSMVQTIADYAKIG
ncbi:MAG TPA: sugar phosphate nucleotidyltransferase [Bacteroidota bacterium]|nr:sugar phosphate nucleotidyltransferase [Bacteroidota bacterium]